MYSFTPATSADYEISYSGGTWSGIMVYQGCPLTGTCVGHVQSSASSKSLIVSLAASTEYFIMFDTWPSPPSPCPGTFSLVEFVPPTPADYLVPFSGSNSITTCSGVIADHGDLTGNYGNNANGFTVINPDTPGQAVQLTFTAFQLECCCDFVTVFDGAGTSGTQLFNGNCTTLPPVLTSTSGPLTIRLTSDGSVTGAGFAAEISCVTLPCLNPIASVSIADDCANNEFSIVVDLTSLGDASTVDIVPSSGSSITGVNTTGVYSLGPYSIGTNVDIDIIHNDDQNCNLSLGSFTDSGNCPIPVTCGQTFTDNHCYGNFDPTTFSYFSVSGDPLEMTFTAGGIEACCDNILIYDGLDNTGTLLYSGNNGGNLAGLSVISASGNLFMEIDSDFSVSCQAGSFCCTTPWAWEIDCPQCISPTATASVVEDCTNDEFFILVDLTDLGDASSVDIIPSVGMGQSGVTTPGVYNLGNYAFGTSVDVDIIHNDDQSCSISLGSYTNSGDCPEVVTCGQTFTDGHCYGNNDLTTFSYTSSTGDPLEMSFTAGGIESCCDNILIYDGLDNTGTLLYSGNNGGNLAGLTVLSLSGNLFMEIASDFSVSCQAGSFCCTTPWAWEIICLPCTPPAALTALFEDCSTNSFTVSVELTDLGDAPNVDIVENVNSGGETTVFTAVSALQNYSMGPYTIGDVVNIRIIHNDDNLCDADLGNFSTGPCPPPNDECANAIMVGCNSVTPGTTTASSTTGAPPGFCGASGSVSTSGGVWYTVQGVDGFMTASTCSGFFGFDTKMAVYTGSCGSFSCVGGNDDASCSFSGLLSTVNWTGSSSEIYYIYVTGFSTNTGDFELAVDCEPFAPNNECANAQNLSVPAWPTTSNTLGNVFPSQNSGTSSCAGATGGDVYYTFTASSTNHYIVTVNPFSGFDAVVQVLDACGGTEVACFNNAGAGGVETELLLDLDPGAYVVRVQASTGTTGAGGFLVGVQSFPVAQVQDNPSNPLYACNQSGFQLEDIIGASPQTMSALSILDYEWKIAEIGGGT
ncbi:MAG: hypothetical protein EA392_11300, partial [Cryomorphaceae bacterium]